MPFTKKSSSKKAYTKKLGKTKSTKSKSGVKTSPNANLLVVRIDKQFYDLYLKNAEGNLRTASFYAQDDIWLVDLYENEIAKEQLLSYNDNEEEEGYSKLVEDLAEGNVNNEEYALSKDIQYVISKVLAWFHVKSPKGKIPITETTQEKIISLLITTFYSLDK